MKRIIFALLIIHCSLLIANAQWVQMSNGMGTSEMVNSLKALGNNIFAATGGSGIYLSSNNGANWTQCYNMNYGITSLAVKGNYIIAGTQSGGALLSTNNGTNWTQIGLSYAFIMSLAVSGNNIFAGTGGNGVFLSTNNGTNWTQTALNTTLIYALAANENNIFGGSIVGIYVSTNNGNSWTQTNNNGVLSFAVNGNNVFAGAGGYYGVFLSTNNGINWIQTSLNNQSVSALAVSGNNVFAGTNNGVYLSTNNGTNWNQINQGLDNAPYIQTLLIANNYIFAGTLGYSVWRRDLSEVIGIQITSTDIPSGYSLSQNYPNPFNPTTKIKFDIAKKEVRSQESEVKLKIYDLTGKEVATLVNEQLQPGAYEVTFDGSNLPSGIYFYQLRSENFIETKKLVLLK